MPCVIHTHLTCTTPSTTLPIDVEYARRHLRGITGSEDELVEAWILAAQQYFEEQTGRSIMREGWEYWLDAFPMECTIEIPRPPLVSVESVTYGIDGVQTPWVDGSPSTALWQATTPEGRYARRGWVEPLSGGMWPSLTSGGPGAVRIAFTAGYADNSGEVPEVIKAALLMLVSSFDQFRSETHFSEGARVELIPFGAEQIIDGFKKTALAAQVLHRL